MKKHLILDAMGIIFLEEDDLKVFMPYLEENCRADKRQLIQPLYMKLTEGEITSQQFFQQLGIVNPTLDFLMNVTLDESFSEFISQMGTSRQVSVLSNDSQEWASYRNTRIGINNLISYYITSSTSRERKPNRLAYERACRLLNTIPQNCFYVDDLPRNLEEPFNLGMGVVLFRRDGKNDSGFPLVKTFPELHTFLSRVADYG